MFFQNTSLKNFYYFLIFVAATIISCTDKAKDVGYNPPKDPLFVQLPASETGLNFSNPIEDGGDYNILTYRNFYNGGGVAIGDINNDNLPDVFLTANLGD